MRIFTLIIIFSLSFTALVSICSTHAIQSRSLLSHCNQVQTRSLLLVTGYILRLCDLAIEGTHPRSGMFNQVLTILMLQAYKSCNNEWRAVVVHRFHAIHEEVVHIGRGQVEITCADLHNRCEGHVTYTANPVVDGLGSQIVLVKSFSKP